MAGEDPDVRRKHHRSPDDGVEEGSKRRKHSHRRSSHRHHHHHRHRSSKHKHETKHEEEEGDDLGLPPPPPVLVVSSPNSRPEDDKEEGEIFEEEENGVVANVDLKKKKKGDSDAESGEIMSEDVAVGKSDNRNPGTNGDGSTISGKPPKETDRNLDVLLEDDETTQGSKNNIEYQLHECSDRTDKILDLTDIADDSRNDQLVAGGMENGMGKIDESNAGYKSSKSRKKKGDKRHGDYSSRDSSPSRANGDIGETSYLVDMKTNRGSKPAKKGSEKDRSCKDIDESVLCRRGRSRSPVDKGDVDSRKNRKIDDSTIKTDGLIDDDEYTSVRHMSRRHLESMDNGRNGLGNRRTSMSPGSRGNNYKSVSRSPSYNRYNDEPQIRNRSMSRDHVRERSVSRSTLQEGRVHHHERDVKSYSDTNDRGKVSESREKAKDEYDHERVGRHGSKDHRSERERSSSYSRPSGREDRHGSRDTRDRDREKEVGRERESRRERERERDRERVRDRNRDKDNGRDRDRDRDSYRGRDRNREREREMERSRDGYKDFRHSKHDEPDYHFEKVRSKGSAKVSSNRNGDSEVSGENLKRDVDEQDDYEERVELKLAQQEDEDIDRIKEESRKRRQAILEKYKQQQSQQQSQKQLQQQVEPHSECPKKEVTGSVTTDIFTEQSAPPQVSVHTVSEGHGSDGTHVIADPLFSVGKSPSQNETPAFERIPGTGGLGDGTPKSERSADMFCDDIFGESPAGVRKMGKGDGLQVERSGLNDNWDDAEGYYSYRFGEILDGRYEVTAAHGKGVFSTVVRAKDLKAGKDDPEEVAIKIIRNNDTMYKAGLEELVILKKLVGADPEDRRHCVRFLSSFKYRNHLCLVFESLHMNLREVLKKFGRNIGLKLTAVRAYAKQLFIALKHLRNCGVLHCDIKPDNMLVNDAKNVLKLCDFGNAMFAGKNEITPYLVSRFYRAPEIILGLSYDHPMDIWSVGCCLYELYSGKVLFPGPSNNDMLRLHMELKGPFPKKMLRKGAFSDQHFDQDLSFHATEEDPVTKKTVKRLLLNIKPKDIGTIITSSPGEDPKMLTNFKDLLERIFILDPDKRMTVSQALSHPFITEHWTHYCRGRSAKEMMFGLETFLLGGSFHWDVFCFYWFLPVL